MKDDWKGVKQNGTSVMSYANKTWQLGVQLQKSDENCVDAFHYILDDYIRFDVRVVNSKEFNEVVAITLYHEMKHKKGKPKEASKTSNAHSSQ